MCTTAQRVNRFHDKPGVLLGLSPAHMPTIEVTDLNNRIPDHVRVVLTGRAQPVSDLIVESDMPGPAGELGRRSIVLSLGFIHWLPPDPPGNHRRGLAFVGHWVGHRRAPHFDLAGVQHLGYRVRADRPVMPLAELAHEVPLENEG